MEENKKVNEDKLVALEDTADLKVILPNGESITSSCRRNIPSVARELGSMISKAITSGCVKDPSEVSVSATVRQKGKPDADPFVIVNGSVDVAGQKLMEMAVHPVQAVGEFQQLSDFLITRSTLKAVLVTMVFEGSTENEPEEAGFALMCSKEGMSPAELELLDASARKQADSFKQAIKKERTDVVFSSDNAGLILPNRFKK